MQQRILSLASVGVMLAALDRSRLSVFGRQGFAFPNPYRGPVLKAVQPAPAHKRARKAAGVRGRKASKAFYKAHRADFVGAQ